MSDPDKTASRKDYTDVRVRLPNRMIYKIEELRKEWGLKSRSDVLARLLEEILLDDKDNLES
tara:strand:- start:157 stop:342 length:186 start_codon:yes stop_codon:yes gene_type:complete